MIDLAMDLPAYWGPRFPPCLNWDNRPPALPQQLSVASLDPATFTQALDAAIG